MSESFREKGYNQVIEVIDKYRPDHLQFDGTTCENLGEDGKRKFLAHYFNAARKWGKEVVVTRGYSSRHPYAPSEIWNKEVMISRVIPLSCSVQNVERRFPTMGRRTPWPDMQQATTPVPGFGYAHAAGREDKTPAQIYDSVNALVDGMVDVTSKNGVTLLSVAPKADGTLPDSQVRVLKKLGDWMRVNKEALHGTDCRTPCAAGTLRFTRKERLPVRDRPGEAECPRGYSRRGAGAGLHDQDARQRRKPGLAPGWRQRCDRRTPGSVTLRLRLGLQNSIQ